MALPTADQDTQVQRPERTIATDRSHTVCSTQLQNLYNHMPHLDVRSVDPTFSQNGHQLEFGAVRHEDLFSILGMQRPTGVGDPRVAYGANPALDFSPVTGSSPDALPGYWNGQVNGQDFARLASSFDMLPGYRNGSIDTSQLQYGDRLAGDQRVGAGQPTGDLTKDLPQQQFHDLLLNDIRQAYRDTASNRGQFWNTLQQYVDRDLDKLVASGQLDKSARDAFNEVMKKDFHQLKQTEPSNEGAQKFWDHFSDKVYSDMKSKYVSGDLPDPWHIDDGGDNPPNPGESASVKEARDKLHKAMEGQLPADRLQRFDAMMKEFEKRGADRVEALVAAGHDRAQAQKEWDDKIAKTYDQLTQMVTNGGANAPFSQSQRAFLAENAMYLFMDPTKENQGGHGTCWIESEINVTGLTNHPDKMASLLNQVATTGKYTDLTGKTITVPQQFLQMNGEEGSWTISNADNGRRSPVGALFDRTITYLEGRTDGGTNGGYPEEAQQLIKRVTGDSGPPIVNIRDNYLTNSDIRNIDQNYRQAMLEYGGVVLLGPGHMFDAKLVKNNGQWQIVGDNQWGAQNDQLIGTVNDLRNWSVSSTRQQYTPEEQGILRASDRPIGQVGNGQIGQGQSGYTIINYGGWIIYYPNSWQMYAPQAWYNSLYGAGLGQGFT
jgi:hypothetical protein